MEAILFFVFAVIAVVSALLVVLNKNPITSILFLILSFFALALLYVLLGAQFIAVMQVIVYAGAIMVLFVFMVMMLNLSGKQKWESIGPIRLWLGFGVSALILLVIANAIKGSLGIDSPLDPTMGTIATVGDTLFKHYVLPFELASVMLLIAIVGVVAMIKQKPDKETTENNGGQN